MTWAFVRGHLCRVDNVCFLCDPPNIHLQGVPFISILNMVLKINALSASKDLQKEVSLIQLKGEHYHRVACFLFFLVLQFLLILLPIFLKAELGQDFQMSYSLNSLLQIIATSFGLHSNLLKRRSASSRTTSLASAAASRRNRSMATCLPDITVLGSSSLF